MIKTKKYNNYPFGMVVLSNTVSFLIYGLGFLIMFRLGWIISILYLIFILILEYRLIRNHCVNCFYWGKTCGFGKGKLSSWFFKKGDISKFCQNEMTWKDVIPDLMVSLVPFITGIVLMIIKFDYVILIAVILLMLLSTLGNGFIRGSLICRYCKQKELGCPADKLFNKDK
ncbi:MAG: hypothetical protein KAT68_08865 [Bacteroidales bacterium]|nr:hypothetical protein [Bacteroidales bacterium]